MKVLIPSVFVVRSVFKPFPHRTDYLLIIATTLAWDSEFKGDLTSVLLDTIADYLSRDRNAYARVTTIVNSSGTGKSRMVDQLGKQIITVPMCLRQTRDGFPFCLSLLAWHVYNPTPVGFPPSDKDLCNWLVSETGDRRRVQKMLHGFTYSLLVVTLKRLETIANEQRDYLPIVPRNTYQWRCRYQLKVTPR
jgi:hypothetical protein